MQYDVDGESEDGTTDGTRLRDEAPEARENLEHEKDEEEAVLADTYMGLDVENSDKERGEHSPAQGQVQPEGSIAQRKRT